MSSLTQWPINQLKIDRAFICNLPGKNNDETITRTLITLGRGLSMSVIAEGVETEAQSERLAAISASCSAGRCCCRGSTPLSMREVFQIDSTEEA